MLSSREKKRLAEAIERHPGIISAYLFGSRSLGHARKDSDVDVAVRIADEVTAKSRFEIKLELQAHLEDLLHNPVDVVIMNEASLVMLHQIFSSGIPLVIKNQEEEEQFKLLKLKEFFDFKYYLDKDFAETKHFFESTHHD